MDAINKMYYHLQVGKTLCGLVGSNGCGCAARIGRRRAVTDNSITHILFTPNSASVS